MIWRTALALASRGRLAILIFHRVLAKPDPLLPGEPSADEFDALLAHVASRFRVVPLAQAARALYAGTLAPRTLAITFDDGYANNLDIAAPILRKHGMPATVFVATGYLDGRCMFNDAIIEAFRATPHATLDLGALGLGSHALGSDAERRAAIDAVLREVKPRAPEERDRIAREILRCAHVAAPRDLMLTRASVRALGAFGLDVGAHSVSHPILARTPSDVAWHEIRESKRDLENLVHAPVTQFAYPNGRPGEDYTDEHVAMVREAGFAFAVSTAAGVASRDGDRLQLPRFTPWTRQPLKFDLMMLRNLQHTLPRARASAASAAA
jgi:peptidoglycan/xylan/chitin deacetylase (PgdA/CDA1 family)